jgi:hypothetical protein
MKKRNGYVLEDRILAYTMFRNGKTEIGLWDIKKIAQLTGHSVDSYKMKIDQFKGIVSQRPKKYVEDQSAIGHAGLNEWADMDEAVVIDYKDRDIDDLINVSKIILVEKFKTHKANPTKIKILRDGPVHQRILPGSRPVHQRILPRHHKHPFYKCFVNNAGAK